MSWQRFFEVRQYPWSDIARRCPDRGLVVVGNDLAAWDVVSGATTARIHRPHGVVLFAINRMIDPLGRYLYFLQDEAGNEIGHLARVPFEGGEVVDLTPSLGAYALVGLSGSAEGDRLALTTACSEGFSLYSLKPEGESLVLIHRAGPEFIKGQMSADGELLGVMSTELSQRRHYALRIFERAGGELAQLWESPSGNFWINRFSPREGDQRLLASGLKGERRIPLVWDIEKDEVRWLEEVGPGEVTPLDWSDDGQVLLLSTFRQGVQSLSLYHLEEAKQVAVGHPPGAFGEYGGTYARFAYFGPGTTVFAHRQDSVTPLRLESYGARTQVHLGAEGPKARPWQNVDFPSSDGTRVQAWLGLPEGAGPFPTILAIHGGPHLVMTEVFSASSQAWMEEGFAFLALNYRGSTTFGCRFQEMIWGCLGRWELEDLVAARSFMVESGWARPEAVFLSGESYGGYLTLWGLAKRPELWAGGMAAVALTDWTETYRDASSALQGAFRNWFGGCPEEFPDRYRDSSPIHFVESIQAPVLMFQGKNDSRTPPRQAALFQEKMKAAGKSADLEWFDGGHALDRTRKIRLQEVSLVFAKKVLRTSPPLRSV